MKPFIPIDIRYQSMKTIIQTEKKTHNEIVHQTMKS